MDPIQNGFFAFPKVISILLFDLLGAQNGLNQPSLPQKHEDGLDIVDLAALPPNGVERLPDQRVIAPPSEHLEAGVDDLLQVSVIDIGAQAFDEPGQSQQSARRSPRWSLHCSPNKCLHGFSDGGVRI